MLGYGALALFLPTLVKWWALTGWREAVLAGGVFGVLQSVSITGTWDIDFPLGMVLFGMGIGCLVWVWVWAFDHAESLVWWLLTIFMALAGAWWTYGASEIDWIKHNLTTPPEFVLSFLGLLVALGIVLIFVFSKQLTDNPTPSVITLMVTGLVLLGLTGYPLIGLGMELLPWVLAWVLVLMLCLMLWFITLNFPNHPTPPLDIAIIRKRALMMTCLIPVIYGLGYLLSQQTSLAGLLASVVSLVVLAFGAAWLPILSTLLGFQAFVQLADEDMI
jgi:hypothetical protein